MRTNPDPFAAGAIDTAELRRRLAANARRSAGDTGPVAVYQLERLLDEIDRLRTPPAPPLGELDATPEQLAEVCAAASRELAHTVNGEAVLALLLWLRPLADEVLRLRKVIADGIDASVANAPCRFVDGGIQMEHWAVRLLVASFAKTVGDAANYVETTATTEDGTEFVATVARKWGKTPHQLRREAEAERDRLRDENARLAALVAELKEDAAPRREG